MSRRPILLGLLVAAIATLALVQIARPRDGEQRAATGQPAPAVV